MWGAVNQLQPADIALIEMFYHEGLQIKEIAVRTGRKEGSIKVRLHRIRKHLKLLMERES
jgi:DNA-directed RNA polymerase specialized sigma24 family protein